MKDRLESILKEANSAQRNAFKVFTNNSDTALETKWATYAITLQEAIISMTAKIVDILDDIEEEATRDELNKRL